MRAMILAAGRGERMGALTATCPKPLLKLAGRPLIDHTIERLRAAGITEIVINLAYLGDKIRAHLGTGAERGVTIAYSPEPEGALDTGGGIAAALPLLGTAPFVVVNSDVWTDVSFAALNTPRHLAHLLMVPNPDHNKSGDFALDNGMIASFGDNMLTFSGIGIYSAELFRTQSATRFPLAPLLHTAAAQHRVTGEVHSGVWIDVGTPQRLALAGEIVAQQQISG